MSFIINIMNSFLMNACLWILKLFYFTIYIFLNTIGKVAEVCDDEMNWEIWIDIYTLRCIKWKTNKNLLYKKIKLKKKTPPPQKYGQKN